MQLNRQWIERHIPHAGRMCLLDEVLEWDANRIQCLSATHRDLDNPLRVNSTLGSACGIEYAAQAMAVHGALIANQNSESAPQIGYIAAVRSVSLLVPRLDDVREDLLATATRVHSDASTALYEFVLESRPPQTSGGNRLLLRGRVTLVFPS